MALEQCFRINGEQSNQCEFEVLSQTLYQEKTKKRKNFVCRHTNIFSEILHKKTRFLKEDGWGSIKEKKRTFKP
jgi:hypothetical protein